MAANRLTIAAQLKAYISGAAIRQKDAAEKCGISAPHFANLLNGHEGIGFAAARRICDAFPEINQTFLITGEGELLKHGPAAAARPAPAADELSSRRRSARRRRWTSSGSPSISGELTA